MDHTRPRLLRESIRFFAHSAIDSAITSIMKRHVNPMTCAIIVRIYK